jgi:ribose 5-phosphate isomerase B
MKIILGADHAGYEMKGVLSLALQQSGHEIVDVGPKERVEGDDYPDYIVPFVVAMLKDESNMGIFCGGSGEGEAIAANRHAGIRAAEYYGGNKEILKLSREHNNANVLCLGARFMSMEEAKEAVKLWLNASFSNDERHVRRLTKIDL